MRLVKLCKLLAFISTCTLPSLFDVCTDSARPFGLVSQTGFSKFVTTVEAHHRLAPFWTALGPAYTALIRDVPDIASGGAFTKFLGHSSIILSYELESAPGIYASLFELKSDDTISAIITRHILEVRKYTVIFFVCIACI